MSRVLFVERLVIHLALFSIGFFGCDRDLNSDRYMIVNKTKIKRTTLITILIVLFNTKGLSVINRGGAGAYTTNRLFFVSLITICLFSVTAIPVGEFIFPLRNPNNPNRLNNSPVGVKTMILWLFGEVT